VINLTDVGEEGETGDQMQSGAEGGGVQKKPKGEIFKLTMGPRGKGWGVTHLHADGKEKRQGKGIERNHLGRKLDSTQVGGRRKEWIPTLRPSQLTV